MSTYSVVFLLGEDFKDFKFHSILTGKMPFNTSNIAVATIINSPNAEHNFPVLNGSEEDALQNAIDFLQNMYPNCKYIKSKIG